MKLCSIKECTRRNLARGMCGMHWMRMKRHGRADAGFSWHVDGKPSSAADVFLRRVIRSDGCWKWPGAKSTAGYGQIRFRRKTVLIHRLSYEIAIGKIPKGLFVCHRCDNPECSNPAHLFLGTCRENSLDAAAKGRMAGNGNLRGETIGTAKLSDDDIRTIRNSNDMGTVLAERFGVSPTTISRVRRGRTWSHVKKPIT